MRTRQNGRFLSSDIKKGIGMSYFSSFSIIWIFGLLIFLGVLTAVIIIVFKTISSRSGEETVSRAVVRSKRTHITGSEHAFTYYYATFELEGGERVELNVGGSAYGALAEGDIGLLKRKGRVFVDFTRDPGAVFDPDGAHKCPACGAVYEGRVCPYCNTPFLKD